MIALTHAPSPTMAQCELTHVARSRIDLAIAVQQHVAYCNMLRECGAEVHVLADNLQYPDCCFVEDTAIVLDEVAILASMGAASRRPEPPGIERELLKYREVKRVQLPATIEGGDVLRVGKTIFVGMSSRTNAQRIDALTQIASPHGYKIVPVRLKDCLHFKSACTALPDQSLLVNKAWLDTDALRGFELIEIPSEEPFAADILTVVQTVCVLTSNPRTQELIRSHEFEVRSVDLSEFSKAEGGITCLSILFA